MCRHDPLVLATPQHTSLRVAMNELHSNRYTAALAQSPHLFEPVCGRNRPKRTARCLILRGMVVPLSTGYGVCSTVVVEPISRERTESRVGFSAHSTAVPCFLGQPLAEAFFADFSNMTLPSAQHSDLSHDAMKRILWPNRHRFLTLLVSTAELLCFDHPPSFDVPDVCHHQFFQTRSYPPAPITIRRHEKWKW